VSDTGIRIGRLLGLAALAGLAAGLADAARAVAERPAGAAELAGHVSALAALWVGASVVVAALAWLVLPRRPLLAPVAPLLGLLGARALIQDASWIVLGALVLLPLLVLRLGTRPLPAERWLGAAGTWVAAVVAAALLLVVVWRVSDGRPERGPERGDPPNLLFISIDTLRADRVGAYGNDRGLTPTLDALAADGIVFEHATAPIPLTGPAHVSMLTGLSPLETGVQWNGQQVDPGADSLPILLAEQGYRTAGFVSGFPLTHASLGMTRAFGHYDDDFDGQAVRRAFLGRSPMGRLLNKSLRRWRGARPPIERSAADTTDRVVEWLGDATDGPFFAFVHYYDPHAPYTPPARFVRDAAYDGPVDGEWYELGGKAKSARIRESRDVARMVGLYDAEVASVDHEIGRLLERLRELGQLERTQIVVTADHGECLGEHGVWYDHVTVYETDLHVPLIVRLPDARLRGTRVAGLVETVDLAATMLDGLGLPEGLLPGDNLLHGLDGGAASVPPELLFAQTELSRRTGRVSYSVSDGRRKLIWNSAYWEDTRYFPVSEELYDLDLDPGETQNRIVAGVDGVETLKEALGRRIARHLEAAGVAEIDPEVLEQLRTLGYVD
jgi:arylsulfatase A-like enzyme